MASIDGLKQRSVLLRALRRFFDDRGFFEVDTPVSVKAPAPELHIEAPQVDIAGPQGVQRRFLQTSPELCMKRLLARGLHPIYQIAPVFRDGDASPLHCPEFRLLEWYRRDAVWTVLLGDCEDLLRTLAKAHGLSLQLHYQGKTIDLGAPFLRVSVDAACQKFAGFSILAHLTPDALRPQLDRLGIHHAADDGWDDLFHRLFYQRIEPFLCSCQQPVFLTDYPAPLGALAQRSRSDPRVVERFELFVAGIELANGFGELTDATEQRHRFVHERALRAAQGRRDYPLDESFLSALQTLPPSAGIALGWERLLMLLMDVADIDDVAFVPWSDT